MCKIVPKLYILVSFIKALSFVSLFLRHFWRRTKQSKLSHNAVLSFVDLLYISFFHDLSALQHQHCYWTEPNHHRTDLSWMMTLLPSVELLVAWLNLFHNLMHYYWTKLNQHWTAPVKNKLTKMYLKYIYLMLSILQIRLKMYVLNKNTLQLYV